MSHIHHAHHNINLTRKERKTYTKIKKAHIILQLSLFPSSYRQGKKSLIKL
jgi:hypothetical protein